MGTGYLQVFVTTANQTAPIPHARVQIKNGSGMLHEGFTDGNGRSQNYGIQAPDAALTLDPNYGKPAYSTVDVTVSAEGYVTQHIRGVEIVDTQLSELPVSMEPYIIGQPSDNYIDIPPLGLFMEHGPYHANRAISGRALNEIVIPTYITVHLGIPANSSARNITVRFIDYIKNVASSEIYSTWPQNSLVANIHAIVTFALNRVYTEWYRTQGYGFDISNSTQYDMAYREGANIFMTISNIVDDIFNVYAHRFGFRNPYFTSFCNGTTSTCYGLSQWGTVNLANQGRTPIQILRYYYPSDITLSRSNNITAITESFPGYTLSQGSSGAAVKRMQDFLNRIRVNYPLIPRIENPNGYFGADTATAVRTFQNIFGLSQTGTIPRATWNKISSIYVGIARMAELNGEGDRISIGENPPNVTLSLGSRGNNVLELQFILNVISQYYSDIPSVIMDGVFDERTRQSVLAFQKRFGISQTGNVATLTWPMLYSVYRSINNISPPPPPPPPTGYFNYTVVAGDTLWAIAQRFGTTVETLMIVNSLGSSSLSIGQVLRIPTGTPTFNYTVVAGDTLWLIAQRFGTTVDELMRINRLTNSNLSIGQVLQIPGSSGGTDIPYFSYTVAPGDTLWFIAQRYVTTVEKIISLNGLTSTNLEIGQVLRIPIETVGLNTAENATLSCCQYSNANTRTSICYNNRR